MAAIWPTHVVKARYRKSQALIRKKRARRHRHLVADGKRQG